VSEFLDNIQYRIKTSSREICLFGFKLVTGMFLGLTLTLIFQQMMAYGTLSFVFVLSAVTLVFLKIAKSWNWLAVMIFILICVLLGLLVRMYILIAPGA
jgi:hypothetical protein